MAASGQPARQPRRGPAPIASFDHDGSDESSPETKQPHRLPEIREDPPGGAAGGDCLAPPEQRARSHSTPAAGALHTPAAPRIDISRASSSSHHDSRDSSPELALFAGGADGGEGVRARLELGFREDGALDLRSSTEELAFLEEAPRAPPAAPTTPSAPAPPSAEWRHSRKDSQGSEAALLAVSGRTSRLSSVGSQCSAHSALSGLSRASRLSVVSGVSRSPSPHKMLLETSFCGPRPIETDPEICAAAVEERLLEIAKLSAPPATPTPAPISAPPPAPLSVAAPSSLPVPPPMLASVDARDRREVRTEVTVENAVPRSVSVAPPAIAIEAHAPGSVVTTPPAPDDDKHRKETSNRARAEGHRARPRLRREPSEPEVYKSGNRSKNVIRIKLKPDEDYDEEEIKQTSPSEAPGIVSGDQVPPEPGTSGRATRPTELVGRAPPSPAPSHRRAARDSRTPSPAGPPVSRKSSFCSLFKSRETIASPDSPSDALRRKRSLTEGRSRSKSRDRSATPTSASKIKGSVLSLFRTPRRSVVTPSPGSRDGSPVVHLQRPLAPAAAAPDRGRTEKLKYYEEARDGVIHIPLHTPPDERTGSSGTRRQSDVEATPAEGCSFRDCEPPRPASAPTTRLAPEPAPPPATTPAGPARSPKPVHRTVLPDGSIIIPLRSPTETTVVDIDCPNSIPDETESPAKQVEPDPSSVLKQHPPVEGRDAADGAEASPARERPPESPSSEAGARADPPPPPLVSDGCRRRKERFVFTTHVGSREQVFSTQFSITKTPSVCSEISGSFPSFGDGEEVRPPPLRDTHIATEPSEDGEPGASATSGLSGDASLQEAGRAAPGEAGRDSSGSEPSSEAAASRAGNEVERRGLVVQESFEEELPYVPTTLPLERSVALPMVPVRERGGVRVSGLQRPRAAAPPPGPPRAPRPAAPSAPAAPAALPDKLRIRLPRRSRPTSAAPPTRTTRPRTRSGGDGAESRPKPEWIDFEEVPERRKQPKRIQTLPAGEAGEAEGGGAVVFSYVEPEHCRCECHAQAHAHSPAAPDTDDQLPLLNDQDRNMLFSASPPEVATGAGRALPPHPAALGLRLRREAHLNTEMSAGSLVQH